MHGRGAFPRPRTMVKGERVKPPPMKWVEIPSDHDQFEVMGPQAGTYEWGNPGLPPNCLTNGTDRTTIGLHKAAAPMELTKLLLSMTRLSLLGRNNYCTNYLEHPVAVLCTRLSSTTQIRFDTRGDRFPGRTVAQIPHGEIFNKTSPFSSW